jgi:hypothetical protein
VVLAVALTLALAGCGSDSPATDGPLGGAGRGTASVWACARLAQPVTFGTEEYTNDGHSTVVLDHVGLRDHRGEHIIGAYAVPAGNFLVGVTPGWPPKYLGMPGTWKYRQPVHDFRLAPGKRVNLVLGVVATTTLTGRSQGIVLDYHDPAGSYVLNDHLAMIIITRRHCTPP